MDYTAEYTEKVRSNGELESDVLVKDDKGGTVCTLAVTGYKNEAERKLMVLARLKVRLAQIAKEAAVAEHPVMKASETIKGADLASEE